MKIINDIFENLLSRIDSVSTLRDCEYEEIKLYVLDAKKEVIKLSNKTLYNLLFNTIFILHEELEEKIRQMDTLLIDEYDTIIDYIDDFYKSILKLLKGDK